MTTDTALDEATAREESERRHGRGRRGAVASYLVMVFALITLNFWLPRAMPGDPITALLGAGSSGFVFGEDARRHFEEYYDLDGSLVSQYGNYMTRLVQGDLGRSIQTNVPVTKEIRRRLPWTLLLTGSSIVLATGIGMAAGIHSGWRRDKPVDRALLAGMLTVWQFPPYLLGSMLLFLFGVRLGWLPVAGADTPFNSFGLIDKAIDIGRHLLLPLIVLTAGLTAVSYLVMRAGMVNELGSDYLLLGRAKGLRTRRLKYAYAARNALLPLVGLTAVEVGSAVAANVFVEQIFAYPGLGELLFSSIGQRDYPTIQGVFLVLSLSVVTINALAEILYRRLDPRTTR
jgi:peptide/nickel transport system permease protein